MVLLHFILQPLMVPAEVLISNRKIITLTAAWEGRQEIMAQLIHAGANIDVDGDNNALGRLPRSCGHSSASKG